MVTINISTQDDAVFATLAGRLDTAASVQFSADMEPLMDSADRRIILDCTDLQFVSSSGLRLLLMLRKATIAKGGSVTIRNVSPDVAQVFSITGFYSLFDFE